MSSGAFVISKYCKKITLRCRRTKRWNTRHIGTTDCPFLMRSSCWWSQRRCWYRWWWWRCSLGCFLTPSLRYVRVRQLVCVCLWSAPVRVYVYVREFFVACRLALTVRGTSSSPGWLWPLPLLALLLLFSAGKIAPRSSRFSKRAA